MFTGGRQLVYHKFVARWCSCYKQFMIFSYINYRTYLKDVLVQRQARNAAYSLRAMSQQLKISPASLSGVLQAKKNFSPETANKVAEALNLDANERDYFLLLVQYDGAKTPELKNSLWQKVSALNPQSEVFDLSLDHFKIISEWYHFAIMASTELADFDESPRILSKRFGITPLEAQTAIERMLRLEMLERTKNGALRKTKSNPRVISEVANTALRTYHQQTLQKATEALHGQTGKEKFVGSETLTIDSRQLPAYEKIMEECFTKILALGKATKKKDHVYHVGIQMFRLTAKEENKN